MRTAGSIALSLLIAASLQAAPVKLQTRLQQTKSIPNARPLQVRLEKGQTFEINVALKHPSQLPANGRVTVTWRLIQADVPHQAPHLIKWIDRGRKVDAFGIYTKPTANWNKQLHALDPDVFMVYRAPVSGVYALDIHPSTTTAMPGRGRRWREKGAAPRIVSTTRNVRWPKGKKLAVEVQLLTLDTTGQQQKRLLIEAEPNDTPEQAQTIVIPNRRNDFTFHVIGSSDDIEYFDNGKVGSSGDDWLRLDYRGKAKRIMSACLSIPDQQVAARIRVYRLDPKSNLKKSVNGQLLPIKEYTAGKNPNERNHQQAEQHRIAINRFLEPGHIYFLRVEANAPGYDLELRVNTPAPYRDPRRAIRHGIYDHLGQVDSWIVNRPRGASVERRIRDTGNLLGTNCMSCHTQSGVWGPAIPFAMGYRPQNIQLWRHLVNTCYQSLRPTNVLKNAANNTSLRPLDLGDGPAGTRVAGHAVISYERYKKPRKLQSMQQLRTANFVLLSGDPRGINAAGPGANVGEGVVFNYTGEIVFTAWKKYGEPRFFRSLEAKARRMLGINLKYCDDLGHRIEFFSRYFPRDYVAAARRVAQKEKLDGKKTALAIKNATDLAARIKRQIALDLKRLRAIQLPGGGWSFDPGQTRDGGKTYTLKNRKPDPSPTALALIGFEAAGFNVDDPTVARGIRALLKMQAPTGYWSSAQTGFVSTSYAVHALSRFYPTTPPVHTVKKFQGAKGESLAATVRRVREMSVTEEPKLVPLMLSAARHPSAVVRYWAMIGLGGTHTDTGVKALISGLADRRKMVREAAHWAMRQTLIDDRGWDEVFAVLRGRDDVARTAAMRALVMKVDGVMPKTKANWERLTRALSHGLNQDSHPGVRAWATRAAWQWWVWNPPTRKVLNEAWLELLQRPEANTLVENAIRYQSHALFIANGHVANGSKQHQYKQLTSLFGMVQKRLDKAIAEKNMQLSLRLARRLTAVASTYFQTRGGDGGPGQMGYVTPGSGDLFATAILTHLKYVEANPKLRNRDRLLQVSLEGAANIPHEDLQEKLVKYSISGPEKFRALAASSISDPRLVSLIAVEEKLEPMFHQLLRGAAEPPRRKQLSDPILQMFGRVRWIIPKTREQRIQILKFMLPDTKQYYTAAQIKKLSDPIAKAKAAKQSEATWYLADGLGKAIAANPDLHFDTMAESVPAKFGNVAEARLWLRSTSWILTFKTKLPEVKKDKKALPPIDPYEVLRTRALTLFLSQLKRDADPRNRREAVRLTNTTALRRNPEVLAALDALLKFEKDKNSVKIARKVLSQGRGKFIPQLQAAIAKENRKYNFQWKNGKPVLPDDFVADMTYFRDYVVPEMSKVLRGDERSCMICHGTPGRVPSMELFKPDDVGYLPVDKLLVNYRVLQERVDLKNVKVSKLLRKPLNIQSGKEDGHQGGRRYAPNDPGYLILTRWANSQLEIQKKYGRPQRSRVIRKKK